MPSDLIVQGAQESEVMTFMPLGGGQEVGRSCILLKYKGRTLLLDCGIHPGREGIDACPFFDSINPEEVDIILITHFHLDHCASLPYFTEKTNFRGKVYMTHATKAVMRLLVADSVKLTKGGLYDDDDLQNCLSKIEVIDFHQSTEFKGIRFCAYAAGHVLGAAMFTIDIDGVIILYTGDYSMEEDRHLSPAEIPLEKPDVLIVESTYGVQAHSSREERESRFRATVEDTVRQGGNCLIPVFALGRAQELLLILDEHWQEHPELQHIPIFYASRLANKALRVYQTFVNMMNKRIRTISDISNPFKFSYIQNFQNEFESTSTGPCVVIASPGMLQSGCSRVLFERWCDNENNSVILAGYSVEGTLAKKLLQEPEEITCLDGRIKARKCAIEYISFSAHVDYIQNSYFIRTILPDNIILVHGEQTEMKRLKEELDRDIDMNWSAEHKPPVVMPKNCQKVSLTFNKSIRAEVVGRAADNLLYALNDSSTAAMDTDENENDNGTGTGTGDKQKDKNEDIELPPLSVFVSENFVAKVMSVQDVSTFTSCRLGRIRQKFHIPIPSGLGISGGDGTALEVIYPYVSDMFDTVECITQNNDGNMSNLKKEKEDIPNNTNNNNDSNVNLVEIIVQGMVSIKESSTSTTTSSIIIDWLANPMADIVADSIVSIVQQALSASSIVISNTINKKRIPPTATATATSSSVNTTNNNISSTQEDITTKKMKMTLINKEKIQMIKKEKNEENIKKLRKLQHIFISSNEFSDVLLNNDGTSLIFRRKEDPSIEAFVTIIWGGRGQMGQHKAMLKCEDESFQVEVSSAMRRVDDMLKLKETSIFELDVYGVIIPHICKFEAVWFTVLIWQESRINRDLKQYSIIKGICASGYMAFEIWAICIYAIKDFEELLGN
eukprot:gene2374-4609_t